MSNNNARVNPNLGRDTHSNQSENEQSSQGSILRPNMPSFFPREEPIIEVEELVTKNVDEIAAMYARLDLEIQKCIPFKEYYEVKTQANPNRRKNNVDKDIK